MQTDGNERSPLLEIKPASDHFRWLNQTRSLLAVIARSREVSTGHHSQPLAVSGTREQEYLHPRNPPRRPGKVLPD